MKIPIKKMFFLLLFTTLFLLMMHTLTLDGPQLLYLEFNIDKEANIPTWFSTVLLFTISITAFVVYWLENNFEKPHRWRYFWILYAAFYAFLSFDEAAMVHEIIDKITRIKWIFVYAPFAGVFFILTVYYLVVIRKYKKTILLWVIGGLMVFAFGGLFMEFVSYAGKLVPFLQQIEYILEEGGEMLGSSMVLMGVLTVLNQLLTKLPDLTNNSDKLAS